MRLHVIHKKENPSDQLMEVIPKIAFDRIV